MKKTYFTLAIAAALLSACATTQTSPSASLQVAPEKAAANIPAWFITPPESTQEAIFVVGTSVSRDLAMSVQKASLDAETHLANKIAGEVSSMTKDYKRDVGDNFTQSTEIVTNKIAAEVKIIGGVVEKKQITPEGGGFRTYVLIKYPVSANKLLQNYEARRSFTGSKDKAEAELDKKVAERRGPDSDVKSVAKVEPVVNTFGGVVVKVTPADEAEEN